MFAGWLALAVAAAAPSVSLTHQVEPAYPAVFLGLPAPAQRCATTLLVGVDGAPERVTIAECPPLFAQAAEAAAMQWRFAPQTLAGRPLRFETEVTLAFPGDATTEETPFPATYRRVDQRLGRARAAALSGLVAGAALSVASAVHASTIAFNADFDAPTRATRAITGGLGVTLGIGLAASCQPSVKRASARRAAWRTLAP